MLPWREKDNPDSEQMTIWSIFPGNTPYFEPSPASFMVNYIVDDVEALLDRTCIAREKRARSFGKVSVPALPAPAQGDTLPLWQP